MIAFSEREEECGGGGPELKKVTFNFTLLVIVETKMLVMFESKKKPMSRLYFKFDLSLFGLKKLF